MPYTFLPDTSVMYNRRILEFIEDGVLDNYHPSELESVTQVEVTTIVLSRVMLSEIENQANQTKAQENVGLEVLHELYRLKKQGKILTTIVGERPKLEQIKLNPGGELDALIREDALKSNSILITADEVQSSVALVQGIDVLYTMNMPELDNIQPHEDHVKQIQDFFDDKTMSAHLRGHCKPMAKRGRPGDWKLEPISEDIMEPSEVAEIANRIIRDAKNDEKSFVERNENSVSVIQLRKYRIVICRPPFSNTYEITAVKPLVRLTLADYDLPRKMFDRLDIAEGILVAGNPGAGKSTFISALSDFYLEKNKLVKTMESVRDLDVSPEVSQYAPLNGSLEGTSDILLLIRPDFTIFDEVRVESDFKIFADMRLAGIGLVGVVHASKPVDAVQRFIRRVELGVIPNVIDTIIFIDSGEVAEILSLEMTVKKPSGFADRDLSRPVIEVRNFMSNELVYEIYAFGSDVIVAPIGGSKRRNLSNKKGSKYKGMNAYAGHAEQQNPFERIRCHVYRRSKAYIISVDPAFANSNFNFYAGDRLLFNGALNKMGELSIKNKSPMYSRIQKALREGKRIEASQS
ncbi:putative KH and PIN-domain containing protein [Candidatus Lokiarchaeum ossiferum]|uniref:KH and PIN-domain containing protein n=1 Tax=Candidatus Lokiarchaeum ossiferum TaxID=2951803 RepID=A0ABY6HLX1_9ARCH|nr:putative KH and PIN-domain containing protein [Candidatus Lokiarchaeum sp. B-35]